MDGGIKKPAANPMTFQPYHANPEAVKEFCFESCDFLKPTSFVFRFPTYHFT